MGSMVASGYKYQYQSSPDSTMHYFKEDFANARKSCPAKSNYALLTKDDSYSYDISPGGGFGERKNQNYCTSLNQGREGAGVHADIQSISAWNSGHYSTCYFDCFQVPSAVEY